MKEKAEEEVAAAAAAAGLAFASVTVLEVETEGVVVVEEAAAADHQDLPPPRAPKHPKHNHSSLDIIYVKMELIRKKSLDFAHVSHITHAAQLLMKGLVSRSSSSFFVNEAPEETLQQAGDEGEPRLGCNHELQHSGFDQG